MVRLGIVLVGQLKMFRMLWGNPKWCEEGRFVGLLNMRKWGCQGVIHISACFGLVIGLQTFSKWCRRSVEVGFGSIWYLVWFFTW